MSARKFLYVDCSIAGVRNYVSNLREEYDGNLVYEHGSIACIIADVLEAMGMPAEGIQMILGPDEIAALGVADGEPLSCGMGSCDGPATNLVQVSDGWRLACNRHAAAARQAGLSVNEPQQELTQ